MKVSTEQEWQAARKELLAAERELEEHAERVVQQRRELPWVPVEEDYSFATEDGPKPDLESAVSVSAGWSVFAMRDSAAYNTYRVYPPSRLVTPLFSVLLGLLPTS